MAWAFFSKWLIELLLLRVQCWRCAVPGMTIGLYVSGRTPLPSGLPNPHQQSTMGNN